jgi:hypothetical protein
MAVNLPYIEAIEAAEEIQNRFAVIKVLTLNFKQTRTITSSDPILDHVSN